MNDSHTLSIYSNDPTPMSGLSLPNLVNIGFAKEMDLHKLIFLFHLDL